MKKIATRGPFLESPNNFSRPKTCFLFVMCAFNIKVSNINHKGVQRIANEYAEERRIYKDLISKNEK